MASCKSVITSALQKLGIAGTKKAPRQEDLDLGLSRLRSYYLELVTSGALGRPNVAVPKEAVYVCRENDRVIRRDDFLKEIRLPDLIEQANCEQAYDGFYDSRSTFRPRPPRNGAFAIMDDQTAGTTAVYIYEALTAKWASILDISLAENVQNLDTLGNVISITPESTAPLSFMGDAGLAAALAVKMADDFGITPSATTIRNAQDWKNSLISGYGDIEEQVSYEFF